MKKKYDRKVEEFKSLQTKCKLAQQKARRQRAKVASQQQIITGLHKRLCESGNNILNNCFPDIIKEMLVLHSNVKVHEYPQSVKKFALTIHFYSAQAYQYLKKFFKLPHPRTLRLWATAIDGNPGFTEQSFIKIGNEVKDSSGPILGALMFDEMAIKKDIIWDGKQIYGYVDLGQGNLDNEDCDVAKEALVFMVTALNKSWKIPVGYCLVNSISSSVKLNLVQQYLRKLRETGIKIVAIVCVMEQQQTGVCCRG